MKLPGGDSAVVDPEKLIGCCLNPDHPRGKHKARVFATSLGFTAQNSEELRFALLAAAASGDAQQASTDRFGTRYVIDSHVQGPRGTGIVRSMWILLHGEDAPRLTSCYVR
jgi:hypothetical protein